MFNKLVCYVCGIEGANGATIHTKPREKGAYFPFLESHERPKGSRLPTRHGCVDACSVCYSFLNQQWESFERTKTPVIKRLYWLKRHDNGPFTGAQMQLQGEYAAQVMGLLYHPSDGNATEYGFASSSNSGITCKDGLTSPTGSTTSSHGPHPVTPIHAFPSVDDGVLDLSVPVNKPKHNSSEKVSKLQLTDASMICFICGHEQPSSLFRFIYSRKYAEDEPYFPFLEDVLPPDGAMPLTRQGLTRVCSGCRKTLSRQWKSYSANQVSESERVYRINDIPIEKFITLKKPNCVRRPPNSLTVPSGNEPCYLCAQICHRNTTKLLYTKQPEQNSKHSMYFPFIRQLKCPSGARPVDFDGRVSSCRACYSYLQRQWQAYQVYIDFRKIILLIFQTKTLRVFENLKYYSNYCDVSMCGELQFVCACLV